MEPREGEFDQARAATEGDEDGVLIKMHAVVFPPTVGLAFLRFRDRACRFFAR